MADSIVRSVRMSPDLWAFVIARAAKRNVPVNAWMVRCVEDAKARLEGGAHAKTVGEQIAGLSGFGPVQPVPGSRLKKR